MTTAPSYENLLETSRRINWRLEDVIGGSKRLDFSRPFLPESFARTASLSFLSEDEQLKLNQIRGFGYVSMFELVERCILPYINAQVPSAANQDAHRSDALSQFASEEEKHIELFVRFREEFAEGFELECGFIGPAEELGAVIRNHSDLALAIFVLAIEWGTQRHYVDSIRDNDSLDPQFKSMFKHHWLEESQHVKLDTLVFAELAASCTAEQIESAVDEFLDIGGFIDGGLKQQAELDLQSLETVIGRRLSEDQRARLVEQQHQAMRWTFIGSALVNKGFLEALEAVSPAARAKIDQVAPVFC
jgi:demethoxyubiquinone hydroxylase (CLK1/Coq7/Cat5 family)